MTDGAAASDARSKTSAAIFLSSSVANAETSSAVRTCEKAGDPMRSDVSSNRRQSAAAGDYSDGGGRLWACCCETASGSSRMPDSCSIKSSISTGGSRNGSHGVPPDAPPLQVRRKLAPWTQHGVSPPHCCSCCCCCCCATCNCCYCSNLARCSLTLSRALLAAQTPPLCLPKRHSSPVASSPMMISSSRFCELSHPCYDRADCGNGEKDFRLMLSSRSSLAGRRVHLMGSQAC